MKRKSKTYAGLIFLLLLTACAAQEARRLPMDHAAVNSTRQTLEYYIQPGDRLNIKFFYNPTLNEIVTVRPDGRISLLLLDDVMAAGLTPAQLDQELTTRYAVEISNPAITVIVEGFTSEFIYVGGEVTLQSMQPLVAGMTPLNAVISAGGFKETAAPDAAILIRKGPDGRPIPIRIDLSAAIARGGPGASLHLMPSDVIYVPKSAIAEADKFVNQYIEQLLLFRGVSLGFGYDLNQ